MHACPHHFHSAKLFQPLPLPAGCTLQSELALTCCKTWKDGLTPSDVFWRVAGSAACHHDLRKRRQRISVWGVIIATHVQRLGFVPDWGHH